MRKNGRHKQNGKTTYNHNLASIGEISAGIAHEVKNPLTAVKGFLQLMQKETEHEYLNLAQSELNNALATLNDLLQVSKPDMNSERFTKINLCSELESILSLFQDQVYRITFVKSFRDTQQDIYGKKNLLKKAFFNLIKNAIEAIPDSGTISIEHYRENDDLCIQVTDTGLGIPEEKLKLLGTPYFSTKDEGTGMGLAQAFSTFAEHGAAVDVESEINKGTLFMIRFPVNQVNSVEEVQEMEKLEFIEGQNLSDYFEHNQDAFKEQLQLKSKNDLIENVGHSEVLSHKKLIENGLQIIELILNNEQHQLLQLAKEEGVSWAKADLPALLYLEWFQSTREIYWDFLYNYYFNIDVDLRDFFNLEKKINSMLVSYLTHYFTSYSDHRNAILHSQREMIDELSVPVIPLSNSTAILPIIGTIDTYRAKKIQEKALEQIEQLKIKKMIIDLSGVAYMDTAVINRLLKFVDGFKMMGCETIVTGVRSEIVNTMIDMGINLSDKIKTFGDLQQALEDNTA